jgi:HEAT repeat protein
MEPFAVIVALIAAGIGLMWRSPWLLSTEAGGKKFVADALAALPADLRGEDWRPGSTGVSTTTGGLRLDCQLLARDKAMGEIGSFQVEIFDTSRRIPPSLAIHARGSTVLPASAPDRRTGDEVFDDAFRVLGETEAVAAVLTAPARRLVQELRRGASLNVDHGKLTWNLARERVDSCDDLALRIRNLVELAHHLRLAPGKIPFRLAENARRDPSPGVRLRCLQLLLGSYRESAELKEAAEVSLAADVPEVRLLAAGALRTAPALRVLRTLVHDDQCDDAIRTRALDSLADVLPPGELVSLVQGLVTASPPNRALRITAIRAVGRRGVRESLSLVLKAATDADEATMAAVAEALGALADPAAERLLLSRLESREESTRVAVIRALGQLGTAMAVEPLSPLAKGLLHSGELKEAAREAIESIQRRIGGAQDGQLSLAELPSAEGALSLPVEGGDLSLADPTARASGPPFDSPPNEGVR